MHTAPAAQSAYKPALSSLIVASFLISPPSFAQETEDQGPFEKVGATFKNIAKEGRWDLYLSGFAYHDRSTYTDSHIRKMNEKAWGGGIGKTIRNERGNNESLYFMVIRDSIRRPQWMTGYAYEWIHPIGASGKLEAGAGITALITRRSDWWGGKPIPGILPIASIGTQNAKLMATFLPRFAAPKGKGNVVLLFARIEFD